MVVAQPQLFLQKADSLNLYFPSKPLEKESFPPAMVFVDDYLMVFPGDFSAHFYQKTDTGYHFQSTIKFWTEKKGKLSMSQAFQFFVANGALWGLGNQGLHRYDLPNPIVGRSMLALVPKSGGYLSTEGFQKVVVDSITTNSVRLYLPTIRFGKTKDLHPSEKVKQICRSGSMFASFDLKLDAIPKVVDRKAYGANLQTDTAAFANYHYSWLREGNIASDGRQIFHGLHASGKIRCFDLQGQLIDSIDARGQSMPNPCIYSPKALTRAAVYAATDSSGFYQSLMVLQNGKYIARQYSLPKDANGKRASYLQLIDLATNEMLIPSSFNYLKVINNQLFMVSEWDFAKGFVKIQFFDIHIIEG